MQFINIKAGANDQDVTFQSALAEQRITLEFVLNQELLLVIKHKKFLKSAGQRFRPYMPTDMYPHIKGFFCLTAQEESEPQRQQEEGQPEGPASSRPLDPPWGDGDEEHGESAERRPVWARLAHPVLPGPPAGRTQPIRESDWQQEQPLRYLRGVMLKRVLIF